MALYGFSMNPSLESVEVWHLNSNMTGTLIRLSCRWFNRKSPCYARRTLQEVRCSSLRKALSPMESEGNSLIAMPISGEEPGDVTRFKISDFKVLDRVRISLAGRADEVVFEAAVKDSRRVVLRQFNSPQAQRRGRRAIELLKKLVHRRVLYHSYSMQVYGYVSSHLSGAHGLFTLVHGYHGSFSLRHWFQQSDCLPTLEATLALDEESVRRVGDDSVGGPAVSRQLRLIRMLIRDLLIGVNYLHSHGIAHTELRLENVHISPADRHIKGGILGNAADFYEDGANGNALEGNMDRGQMMIAFDMRCIGFMMAKMLLRELMDPRTFAKFKSFLMKGNDPSCLREFLLPILTRNSPTGNVGLQDGIFCHYCLQSDLLKDQDALRHPFLCGPRWRVVPSMDMIRWGLGSTAVRIIEEYIYRQPQNWLQFLPGKWRLLYSTGRHVGLTLRQPPICVLIGDACLTIGRASKSKASLSVMSEIGFTVMLGHYWPHDKGGIKGKLQVNSLSSLKAGKRPYFKEKPTEGFSLRQSNSEDFIVAKLSSKIWRKAIPFKEFPSSLPVAKLLPDDTVEVSMSLNDPSKQDRVDAARRIVQEIRTQIPPEMFELSNLVCGTYVDSSMLVLRGVNGSALIFTRSCANES